MWFVLVYVVPDDWRVIPKYLNKFTIFRFSSLNETKGKIVVLYIGRNLLLHLLTRRAIKLTSNYQGISLLSTTNKILSNIPLSRLTPYVDRITGDQNSGF
jgi:hypothetical protein